MNEDMTPSVGPRVVELEERVRARDIAWLRAERASGGLSWLMPHLGQVGYHELTTAIDDGDIDLVGRRIAILGDRTTVIGAPVPTVTAAALPSLGGDPLTTHVDDPTLLVSRHGAVLPASAVRRERNTLVVVAILVALVAAAIIAFLIVRNNDDNADTADTTVLTSDSSLPADTVPPDSVVVTEVDTTPSVVLATAPPSSAPAGSTPATPSSAPGTIRPAASPSTLPVPAPVVTTPLADAITTAGRSATFGPYLTMVEAAGLTDELRAAKNVTLLVPTEGAFTALPPDVQVALRAPANRAILARIVRYNVLTQTRSAAQLTPGNYPTVEGTPVNVQSVNGVIRINDATITGPDIKVANGVLHAIDHLLIPPTLDVNTLVAKSATPSPSPSPSPSQSTPAIVSTTATPTPATTPATTAAPVTSTPQNAAPTLVTLTTVAGSTPSTSPATTSVATTLPATTVATTSRPPTTTTIP